MYCIECAKENEDTATKCKFCGADLLPELDDKQERHLIQMTHRRENVARDKINSGLVFVVLGTMFLIIGILFMFLSFKVDTTTYQKQLSFTCFEFYVSLVGIVAGTSGLIYGIILIIIQKRDLRAFARLISSIRHGTFRQIGSDDNTK